MPLGYNLPIPDGYTPIERHCWLLVVEGEINAMSAATAAKGTRLDVLSIGSESSHLPDTFIQFAQRYGRVLVWADKSTVAGQLTDQLPNSCAVYSPERPRRQRPAPAGTTRRILGRGAGGGRAE